MLSSKLEPLTSLPCLYLLLVGFSPGTSILKKQMNKVFYAKSRASFWYISLTCRHPSPPALISSLETTLPTPVFLFLFFYKVAVQVYESHPSNNRAIYSEEAEYQRVHESKFLDVLFEPLAIAFFFSDVWNSKGSSTL